MVCRGIFLFVAVLGPLAAAQETGIFTGMIGELLRTVAISPGSTHGGSEGLVVAAVSGPTHRWCV